MWFQLNLVPSTEPGVITMKVESLQFKISLNPATLQSLHLKATPNPDSATQWETEELQVLERFFETKVGCYTRWSKDNVLVSINSGSGTTIGGFQVSIYSHWGISAMFYQYQDTKSKFQLKHYDVTAQYYLHEKQL